ncbi:D-glycerate dehydrogenase [Paenibacillaceae bacterium]|nr:D-glycerate dehydrogenase [Paenibacillaceae bacterium]
MSKPRVFIATRIPEDVENYIAQHCEYRKWDSQEKIPRELLLKEAAEADGLLQSGLEINAELLEQAPQLRVVSNISVGYNNFDLTAMKQRNIIGTHTPEVLDETVADLVFGLILASARRIAELDHLVRDGKWKKGNDGELFGLDVHHKKLGIIGMGRIGEAIARRGKFGFGMDILYYNRSRKPDAEQQFEATYCSLEQLLGEADFVVLMTPLTKETVGFIGEAELALMKKTAIFINASRGQTVDEQALIRALQTGQIYGAGLDVYEQEPVASDNPLLQMPNVVALPHIGSATAETRYNMAMLAAQELVRGLTGEQPRHVVKELR